MNTTVTAPPDTVAPDADMAEQAYPGHGIPSQDPSAAAQTALAPHEAEREANSVLMAGGMAGGAATGAVIGVAVAGPVGILVGATLGAAFATVTGQPTGFFAALGFVAVFAGAARAPLACSVLGLELFGTAYALPLALACTLSALVASKRSIYAL